jgi:hypothetical protein
MRKLFLFFFLFISFSGCRKDKVLVFEQPEPVLCDTTWVDHYTGDTIHPSPFLATYPGSYWEYDNGDRDVSVDWHEMPIYSWSENEAGCPVVTRTFVYVCHLTSDDPVFQEWYVCGTNRLINKDEHTELRPIVGEVGMTYHSAESSEPDVDFGSSWTKNYDFKVVSLLPTMEVHGETYENVLHTKEVHEFYYNKFYSDKFYSTFNSYYAEKKGLIYRESSYVLWGWEDQEQSLTNYHIAPF